MTWIGSVVLAIGSPLYDPSGRDLGAAGIVDFMTQEGARAAPSVKGEAPGMACGGFLAAVRPPGEGGRGGFLVGFTLGESKHLDADSLAYLPPDGRLEGRSAEPLRLGPHVALDAVQVRSSRDREFRVAVGAVGSGVYGAPALRGKVVLYAVDGWRPLWTVEGREPGELFGASVHVHPDLDGDGVEEVVVGVPGASPGDSGGTGGVVLLSGATGRLLWEFREDVPEAESGLLVRTVGDLDGDGIAEVMTGRTLENPATFETEIEFPVIGGKDGRLLAVFRPRVAVTRTECAIEAVGDLDADGVGDVAVGIPGAGSGRVVVVSGADGSVLWELKGEDVARDGALGESLAALPDIDGDGLADLAVGAPMAERPGDIGGGVVFLVSGSDGRVLRILQPPE